VKDYRPEPMVAITLENEHIPVICYNLPASETASFNVDYLRKLLEVVKKLKLPESYVNKLAAMKS
jgi:hypothetical protein